MSFNLSPLQSHGYSILKSAFEVNPEFDSEKPGNFTRENLLIQNRITAEPNDEAPAWCVELVIRIRPGAEDNLPYKLIMQIIGFFTVDPDYKTEDPRNLILVNGSSVLFGAAREHIRTFTATGPNRAVVLPTLTFLSTAPDSAVATDGEPGQLSENPQPSSQENAKEVDD
jgi:preprotein translocase subunit SecB